jgi:hypothetical protein
VGKENFELNAPRQQSAQLALLGVKPEQVAGLVGSINFPRTLFCAKARKWKSVRGFFNGSRVKSEFCLERSAKMDMLLCRLMSFFGIAF